MCQIHIRSLFSDKIIYFTTNKIKQARGGTVSGMINDAVGILAINCILKIKSALQYKF